MISPNSAPSNSSRVRQLNSTDPVDADRCLRILGLDKTASWDEIHAAHTRLVSDLTPGESASHSNVERALVMLDEVNNAYVSLCESIAA